MISFHYYAGGDGKVDEWCPKESVNNCYSTKKELEYRFILSSETICLVDHLCSKIPFIDLTSRIDKRTNKRRIQNFHDNSSRHLKNQQKAENKKKKKKKYIGNAFADWAVLCCESNRIDSNQLKRIYHHLKYAVHPYYNLDDNLA